MTRDDVRNLMHDYFDGLLTLEVKESIDSYLEEYEDLAGEYELLSKLLVKAQSLPLGIKTPDTIIHKISDDLMSESLNKIESAKQKKLKELTENTEIEGGKRKRLKTDKKTKETIQSPQIKEVKKNKSFSKIPILLLFILLVAIGGYFIYNSLQTNFPWQLNLEYGYYHVGAVNNKSSLALNETVLTNDSTKVAINIPTSGKVFVRSFSSVQAVQGKDGDNIIKLESGKVDGECGIDKPGLTINTIPARINVWGGNFTASLTPMGELRVKTSNGTVELKSSYESSVIVRDHICEVKPGGNIGVPYHINADSSIIAALNKISFGEKSIADFDFVLKNATRTDGISLLFLLKETQNPNERATIFARLNEFYPVVPGVTQGGIIRLDQTMFDTWRDDIEWQL